MNMLKWDGVNIYDCLCICIFNVPVYFMWNLYFMSAYRGEFMFVRGFVSEIICEQTVMFADLHLFPLRTLVNEKFSGQDFFSFTVTLFCDYVWYKGAYLYTQDSQKFM